MKKGIQGPYIWSSIPTKTGSWFKDPSFVVLTSNIWFVFLILDLEAAIENTEHFDHLIVTCFQRIGAGKSDVPAEQPRRIKFFDILKGVTKFLIPIWSNHRRLFIMFFKIASNLQAPWIRVFAVLVRHLPLLLDESLNHSRSFRRLPICLSLLLGNRI